jgi:hypothetical protein
MLVLRKYKNNRMILLISRNNHERGKTLLDVVQSRLCIFDVKLVSFVFGSRDTRRGSSVGSFSSLGV